MASCSRDKTVIVWVYKPNSLEKIFTIQEHASFVNSVCFVCIDEKLYVYSGDSSGMIVITDALSQAVCRKIVSAHNDNICTLHRGELGTVLSSSWDGFAKVWKFDVVLSEFKISTSACWDFRQYSSGYYISASADKALRLHSPGSQQPFHGHQGCCRSICVLGDNQEFIASVGNDGLLCLWNLDGKLLYATQAHCTFVYKIVYISKTRCATFAEDGIVKMWDLSSSYLYLSGVVKNFESTVWCGTYLTGTMICGGSDGSIKVCDVTNSFHVEKQYRIGHDQIAFWSGKVVDRLPERFADGGILFHIEDNGRIGMYLVKYELSCIVSVR